MVKLRWRGGGGWALRALKERPRGLCPRGRSFVWQAEGRPAGPPLGLPNAAAPRVTQRFPSPLGQRASAGITAVAHGKQESRGGHAGAAALGMGIKPAE